MISLKDFITEQKKEIDPTEVYEELQGEDFLQLENVNANINPPNILMMRRVSIRQFPDGSIVALYWIDSLKQYVTVPFTNAMMAK